MSAISLAPAWLAALRAGGDAAPLQPRQPLAWQGHALGSVDPRLMAQLAARRPSHFQRMLQKTEQSGQVGWALRGDLDATLGELAALLHDLDLGHTRAQWRNERLVVGDSATLQPLGVVERGIVRLLGLTTHAVHLVGRDTEGNHWVQQRSLTKSTDPGLWDTLMGGMVSAADTLQQALWRETWEEAGLRPDDVQDVRHGGQVWLRKPHTLDGGLGYVVERVDWFEATVRAGAEPCNQDGEVARFACLTPTQLVQWLQDYAFTTEAALVLVAALQRSPPR